MSESTGADRQPTHRARKNGAGAAHAARATLRRKRNSRPPGWGKRLIPNNTEHFEGGHPGQDAACGHSIAQAYRLAQEQGKPSAGRCFSGHKSGTNRAQNVPGAMKRNGTTEPEKPEKRDFFGYKRKRKNGFCPTVNRSVVGSSPTGGARKKRPPNGGRFFLLYPDHGWTRSHVSRRRADKRRVQQGELLRRELHWGARRFFSLGGKTASSAPLRLPSSRHVFPSFDRCASPMC